jgi:hypothetical protein
LVLQPAAKYLIDLELENAGFAASPLIPLTRAELPKLSVVGSIPIARSINQRDGMSARGM